MAVLLCYYRKLIVKTNLFLLFSWTVEAIWRFYLEVYLWQDDFKVMQWIFYLALSEINYLIFLFIVFRLKSVELYMVEENNTP